MLNRCEFIGNLGADPESRNLPSGGIVVNLRLAVTNRWRDKGSGEWREDTEWITVAIFNQSLSARAQERLHKGAKVYVSGSWKTRKWKDNNGVEKATTELVIQAYGGELIPLDARPDDAHQPQPKENIRSSPQRSPQAGRNSMQARQLQAAKWDDELDDSIPFE